MIERTLSTTPKYATHWSIRTMAAESGLSHTPSAESGVHLACSRTGQRHSSDPLFVDKVQDIVGLYMSPPAR